MSVVFDPNLERMALDGKEIPNGLEYPEQICYLCFRMLYEQLRKGVIGREVATSEKKKLLKEYEAYKIVDEAGKQWVQILKSIDDAAEEYRKCRSLENADKLLCAVGGGLYEQ